MRYPPLASNGEGKNYQLIRAALKWEGGKVADRIRGDLDIPFRIKLVIFDCPLVAKFHVRVMLIEPKHFATTRNVDYSLVATFPAHAPTSSAARLNHHSGLFRALFSHAPHSSAEQASQYRW